MAKLTANSSSNLLRATVGGAAGGHRFGTARPLKRHRRVLKDTVLGVTKSDIRRLARRGGVKRISGLIYDDMRCVIKNRLQVVLKEVSQVVDHCHRKTVMISDIIFVLNRLGTPIYGFGIAER